MKQNLLLTCLFIIYYIPMQAQMPNDTTTVERFNFGAIGDSRKSIDFLKDNWLIPVLQDCKSPVTKYLNTPKEAFTTGNRKQLTIN